MDLQGHLPSHRGWAIRTSPVLIAQPSWMGYPNFPCVNSPAIVDGLIAQPSWMGYSNFPCVNSPTIMDGLEIRQWE